MPPWREIQYQHEVVGHTLATLAQEYGVSLSELEYAAETWQKKGAEKPSPKQIREELEPQYIALEISFMSQLKCLLSMISPDEPNSAQKLKQLVECYKILRYGDREHDSANDVVVNIINSFAPNSVSSSSTESVRVATAPKACNVTTPPLSEPADILEGPEVISIDPSTGRIL